MLLSFGGAPGVEHPYATTMAEVSTAKEVPLVVYEGPRLDVVHPTAEGYERLAVDLFVRLLEARSVVADPRGEQPDGGS